MISTGGSLRSVKSCGGGFDTLSFSPHFSWRILLFSWRREENSPIFS